LTPKILNTHLNIQYTCTNNPETTLPNTKVNPNNQWTNAPTYRENNNTSTMQQPIIQPCPTYNIHKQLKFIKKNNYTDGSFTPPKPNELDTSSNTTGYGIYNKDKNIKIAQKLPRLQNILGTELTTIHDTIKLILSDTKPTYIFTDSLYSIYLINTQLKHPTSQNNHLDKLLLTHI
jgi:hypothetical protein